MAVQFLRVGVVAIGSLTSDPDSNAHPGLGGGNSGAMFLGRWHSSGLSRPQRRYFMSRIRFLFFAFLLTTLQPLRAEKIDNRNFAIDTYYPTPNEIRLAEQRARKYWEKH